MSWRNAAILWLITPLAWWLLVSRVDDLLLDFAYFWLRLRDRFGKVKVPLPSLSRPPLIALMIPCWRETPVIRKVIERNLREIEYGNCDVWGCVYPNDPQSMLEGEQCSDPRVHYAVNLRNTPKTKADFLNQILVKIGRYELRTNKPYDLFIHHDAEDVIHPSEFSVAARRGYRQCGSFGEPWR